ncbi:DUF1284 domain-containing protein [Aneurinibacillus terranovensis]|uniref:DUF1284 domain-containing protein n=1 Tax=Aneurinibacillus terranovensis TaxID=278991 RepID=UPI0004166376|nr:DUF1284 domain-containing protein [Aneurinibacillus terranovensis]
MQISKLRGHHLLCVHGFQGMGYSPVFIERMRDIVDKIRDSSHDMWIEVKVGFDDACAACPHKGEAECERDADSDDHVKGMDRKVIRHLELEQDAIYRKEWLVKRTAEMVEPDDLDFLCRDCSWLSAGVCKTGLRQLKEKLLPSV